MDEAIRKTRPDPGTLLRVSEHFLRRRHFVDCRKYAHQAYQIDPNFPGVSGIIAVADVLLASKSQIRDGTLPDWYAVMQLDRFLRDSDLIRRRFNYLCNLLCPSTNNFPFADEAYRLVCEAWYVLSNPLKRLEFDDALKKHLDDEKSKGKRDSAIWTVCPYCYYLYEYPRFYLECCLRCANEKCSKAFTCVEIDRPPVEVLKEGKYMCAGFLRLGVQDGGWNPFAPSKKAKTNSSDSADNVLEISDEEEEEEVETKNDKSFNVCGEKVHESVKMEAGMPNTKPDVQRKKSVAQKTKKVTGTGNRVTLEAFVHREETDINLRSPDNDVDGCEIDINFEYLEEPFDPTTGGEVEFYDADGDIFVDLQNGI